MARDSSKLFLSHLMATEQPVGLAIFVMQTFYSFYSKDSAIEDLPHIPKRVIRFMSEAHNDTMRHWSTAEQEAGAVHWALTGSKYEVM